MRIQPVIPPLTLLRVGVAVLSPLHDEIGRCTFDHAAGFGCRPLVATHPRPEQDQRNEQTADSEHRESGEAGDVVDEPCKVLSEETGNEGQRQEHRCQDRQLLHGAVLAHADLGLFHGDDGHVRLQDGSEEVLLGSNFLADEMQVIVHVAQVWPELRVLDIALDASEDGE